MDTRILESISNLSNASSDGRSVIDQGLWTKYTQSGKTSILQSKKRTAIHGSKSSSISSISSISYQRLDKADNSLVASKDSTSVSMPELPITMMTECVPKKKTDSFWNKAVVRARAVFGTVPDAPAGDHFAMDLTGRLGNKFGSARVFVGSDSHGHDGDCDIIRLHEDRTRRVVAQVHDAPSGLDLDPVICANDLEDSDVHECSGGDVESDHLPQAMQNQMINPELASHLAKGVFGIGVSHSLNYVSKRY